MIQLEMMNGDVRAADVDIAYTQTITDTNILRDIESIFRESIFEASGCPFFGIYLTLTYATGEEITMSIARDSCDLFFINGQRFKSRGLIEKVFAHFDQIPIGVIYD